MIPHVNFLQADVAGPCAAARRGTPAWLAGPGPRKAWPDKLEKIFSEIYDFLSQYLTKRQLKEWFWLRFRSLGGAEGGGAVFFVFHLYFGVS